MRDSYVGDIGDFGRHGLLRRIFGGPGSPTADSPLKLGVVWYLNEEEDDSYDGQNLGYLVGTPDNRKRFRDYDPLSYDKLKCIVPSGERNVKSVRQAGILPDSTVFYERPLPNGSRQNCCTDWFRGAIEKTREADVVYIDPDTGMSPPGEKRPDSKHVSLAELRCFWKERKSIIIYQHPRNYGEGVDAKKRIAEWAKGIQCEFGLSQSHRSTRVLWWHRFVARFYFIVPQPEHQQFFAERLAEFSRTEWCTKKWPGWKEPHFTLVN